MSWTEREVAESTLGKEIADRLKTAETGRAEALHEAVQAERHLPHPVVPDIPGCPHHGSPDCDCPLPDEDVRTRMVQVMEEATVDRIMRNAQRFYEWIMHGWTPEEARDRELRAMQDSDGEEN